MFSLNIKQLLDHHVFVPGKTLLPSPWELLYGFMEPFCRSIVIPLVDSHLCSFLTTIEPSYPVWTLLLAVAVSQQISDNWWISDSFNTFFPQESRGAFLLMITFHLVTLVHVLWPLDLVETHQVSQACTTRAIWWWIAVLDCTACYLLKCQLFKSLSE